MLFRSRVSIFLLLLILSVTGIPCIFALMEHQWQPVIAVGGVSLIVLVLLFDTRYIIADKYLYVRYSIIPAMSPFDLTNLMLINKTHSILSAPACSLDRILLSFSDGSMVIISPRHQKEFIEEILKINPNVQVNPELLAD